MVRTGVIFAAVPAALALLLGWVGWWWPSGIFVALAAFMVFFFRDPERAVPATPGAIVAPADGRVLSIEQVEWEGKPHTQVSIFLSVFDVHVDRAPIGGVILDVRYRPGKFHVAAQERASRENEQNEITLEGEGQRVVLRQIAGILARRIEFWKKPGDRIARGARLGMIRFGSRAEVCFESGRRVQVKPGEHVKAGTSILAVRE